MKRFKSKMLLCASLAVAITMGGAFAGCVTINREDVKQVVSTVNIAESQAFGDEFGEYASAVTTKKVLKRDLISAFLSTGYSYVQQGYSYAEVFDMLNKALTENLAVTQYATAYLLKDKVAKKEVSLDVFKSKTTEKEKLEYLLGGAESEGVKTAEYNLKVSINTSLDSYEQRYIKEENKDYVGSGTRSTPTGIDTYKEDYVPENYGVYTGYTGYLLSDAGDEYEPLDNTNRNTRRKAYSEYVGFLDSNYLLTAEDTKTTDVMTLSYVQNLYISQLEQQVITQFGEAFEEEREKIINTTDTNGIYSYIQGRYDKLLDEQKVDYDKASSFETAMGSLSDTSFILYSPDTSDTEEEGVTDVYGYVYNILLPFSTKQSSDLTSLQYYRDNNDGVTESMYFAQRNELLKNITTTDQREAWFNGTTDYSFDASRTTLDYYGKADGRDYLFFENNVSNTDMYEPLEKYIGLYSYNGKVKKNTDGSYSLTPNKLDIDGMLKEFKAYVDYVLGDENATSYTTNASYYTTTDFTKGNGDDKIDYSKLVYATGKVAIDDLSDGIMLDKESNRYKAMSAVNELQYAYTTDVGVLSQYIGYTVSAYETSYIKEFEYSAKSALRTGVGSFQVCAGDYGWHLIYVTDTFEVSGGATYTPNFTVANVEKDGTFENRFYNWIKNSVVANEANLKRAEIVREFVNDDTVKTDKSVYEDLAELGN